ncbi:MAG: PAS domain S-box protein [Candidatus Obscuribacterales bacterium]|nr:PAS domain S-box protein [Candidatus Obscuribacterales bacterium]
MQSSLGVKTSAAVAILILALIGAGWLALTQRDHQTKSRALVIHTYEIINRLQIVLAAANDAETGQRGFLLTGDPQYLLPFTRAKQHLGPVIDDLQALVTVDPTQLSRVNKLEASLKEKFTELDETIELRKRKGFNEALKVVQTHRGKQSMENIRHLLIELNAYETAKLEDRTRELQEITNSASAAQLAFIIGSALAVLLTGYWLHQFLEARRFAEQQLSAQHKLTNFIAGVNKALTEATSTEEIYQLCAHSMTLHLGLTAVYIWTTDSNNKSARLRVTAGTEAVSSQLNSQTEIDQLCAMQRPSRLIAGGHPDKHEGNDVASPKVYAAAAPMRARNAPLGVITIQTREAISDELLLALGTAADSMALGIERQRTARELERNRAELSDFFENAVVGLNWTTPTGVIIRANSSELKLLGYSAANYVGHNIEEFFVDKAVIKEILERLSKRDEIRDMRARLRCADDSIKYVLVDCNAYIENDEVVHCRFITRDVTIQHTVETELQEREARTRAILDTAPDAILIFDEDGVITSANRAASLIFGWSREELPGKNISQLVPGFFKKGTREDSVKTGTSKIFGSEEEYIASRKDGASVPIEFAWSVLNLGERSIYTSVIRDITRRKAAESKLAVQYATARAINESSSLTEITNRILKSICSITGLAVGQLWKIDSTGTKLVCSDLWHSPRLAGSDFVLDASTRTFRKGEGLPGRVWQSGQAEWIEDLAQDSNFPRAPLSSKSGLCSGFAFPIKVGNEVIGAVEFFSDKGKPLDNSFLEMMAAIGAQIGQYLQKQQAEEEMSRQRQLMQLVLNTMSDGIIVANKNGNFIIVNPAAEKMFGKLNDMAPSEWSEHFQIYQADQKTLFSPSELPLAKAIAGESTDEVEIFVRNACGERFINVTGRPVEGNNALFSGGMVVCRDTTERKAADTRVSEFYSTVSHELRTPLTSIRGSLGLIEGGLAGQISEKGLKLVKIARTESDRLIRLINDILDIRKIEAGMFDLKMTTVDMETLVTRTIEGIKGMAVDAGVNLRARIDTTGPSECDEDRVIQVLTNLVSNAIKFSSKGSDVVIKLEPGQSNTFKFSVIDNGIGIPKDQMHKLFGKFQQLDQTDSRKKGGTGLGLAITKAIVERHGGTIGVESTPGEGTCFWFELQATFKPKPVHTAPKLKARHPALLVEDDDNIAAILTEHLVLDGLEVIRASTIAEASALLSEYKPIVIILDLKLPDGNGLELVRRLSTDEEKRDIPIVVVTASGEERNSFGHPALVDWITKPFQEKRLHDALDLAKQQIGPARVLIVEDDSATRTVLKAQLDSMGIKCLEAASGSEALEHCREESLDLIILDLMIPPPNGFDVVNALKQEKFKTKPLIVYTASDLTEKEKSQLQLGLTAHLTKGTTTREQLIGTVRELLNGLLAGKPKENDKGN